MAPRSMDAIVKDMLGAMQLQIAAQQVQIDELIEQLEAAKKANEPKPGTRHEVKPA